MVTTKEQLNRALLDKDCLDQEKGESDEALRKSELLNADLGKCSAALIEIDKIVLIELLLETTDIRS